MDSVRTPAFRRAFISAVLLAGCGAGAREAHPRFGAESETLVAQLRDGPPVSRSLEARTSMPTTYARCVVPDDLSAPAHCAPQSPPDPAALRVAARAAASLRDSLSADALHASALVDLHWGDPRGNSLARSLQSLRRAARYNESAPAWEDLAAAELARADRENEPRARLYALDAAVRAVRLDSASPVARFDLALAAERLGLDGRAREEWMRYLTLADDAAWQREARAHVAAIDRRAVPSASGPLDAGRIRALAARDPTALRTRMLGEPPTTWTTASRELAAHGDSALLRIAAELSRAPLPTSVAAPAAFATAERAMQGGRYADAESLFARAATESPPALAAWSRVQRAIQQVYIGETRRATAALQWEVSAARAHREPALEARAGWTLAVVLLRAGRRADANTILDRISALAAAFGDSDTVGGVEGLRAEDRYAAGDERAAWRLAIEAVSTLRAHRASLRLRNVLNVMAWAADDRGLGGAAATIRDEDAAVALASGHREFHAEALIAAARSRLLAGDTVHALATLREVERSILALPASDVSRWLAARAGQLRAEAGAPVSAAALDSAVRYFGARRIGIPLVDALLARARAMSAVSPAKAEQDLDSALALVKSRAAQYRSTAERRALDWRLHDVAARSALTDLAHHDTLRALAAVERGRMGTRSENVRTMAGPVIDYLLAGDTLVAWRIAAGRVAVTRSVVSARALLAARDRVVRSAESGVMDRAAAGVLYDLLLRAHGSVLRDGAPLAIVADDELAGIPFAALYDTTGPGARLVERVSVRVVSRLEDATPVSPPATVSHALFVSDPAFDRAAFPGLAPLAGARTEVDSSRRFYASSVVLAGAAATTSAVMAAMPGAGLVHFASHARFDPERPEQSRLVLAPDSGTVDGLSARTISEMRLRGVQLAVLSSCESTRTGISDAPLTIGLAKAFHDAGVPAVVGALWKVDDDATAALMTEFHRQYSSTRDAARSLRAAQRTMMRDPNPARRDPAVWGAFVFTGR